MRTAKVDRTIVGKKFGKLTPIQFVSLDYKSRQMWLFKCDCGELIITYLAAVKRGNTKSCGCLKKEINTENGKKNGDRIRQNQLLGQRFSNNTTGVTGVYHYTKSNRWTAELIFEGKKHRVYCKTKEEAIAARKALEEEFGIYDKCLKSTS